MCWKATAGLLQQYHFIAKAMTPDELSGSGPADHVLQSYRNSYIPGRDTTFPLWTREVLYGNISEYHPVHWGIIVEFTENAQLWSARSAHGTAYTYDQEVPIIFMGKGIEAGESTEQARIIDIAPTLAFISGLTLPESVDGTILQLHD